jgi:hypothetical protein
MTRSCPFEIERTFLVDMWPPLHMLELVMVRRPAVSYSKRRRVLIPRDDGHEF